MSSRNTANHDNFFIFLYDFCSNQSFDKRKNIFQCNLSELNKYKKRIE